MVVTLLRHRRRYGTYGRFLSKLKGALASARKKAKTRAQRASVDLSGVTRDLTSAMTKPARPVAALKRARSQLRGAAAFVRNEIKEATSAVDELLLPQAEKEAADGGGGTVASSETAVADAKKEK